MQPGTSKECGSDISLLCKLSVTHGNGNAIWSRKLAYNKNHLIASSDDTHSGRKEYIYDRHGRLSETNSSSGKKSWNYDIYGNLISKIDGTNQFYGYNKVGSGFGGVLRNIGNKQFTYNKYGNIVSRFQVDSTGAEIIGQRVNYEYNAEGLLSQVDGPEGQSVRLLYDGDGKLVERRTLLDTSLFIGSSFECHNEDCFSKIYANGILLAISEKNSGNIFYRIFDERNSTRFYLGKNGEVVAKYSYDSYGAIQKRLRNDEIKPYGRLSEQLYSGSRYDVDLAMFQMGDRWFDPEIGRFLQADPVLANPYSALRSNLYAYAFGNPLRYSDPEGQFGIIGAIVVGAIIGGASAALAGGDLNDIIRGAAIGAIFGAISGGGCQSCARSQFNCGTGCFRKWCGYRSNRCGDK